MSKYWVYVFLACIYCATFTTVDTFSLKGLSCQNYERNSDEYLIPAYEYLLIKYKYIYAYMYLHNVYLYIHVHISIHIHVGTHTMS